MAIRLVVDSSSDLPKEIIDKHRIMVVPLFIHFGENEYKDGVDISNKEFYEKLKESEAPKTSQVTPEMFKAVFNSILEEGDEVLCITIGSNASGTCQSAFIAKDLIDSEGVTVIDSNMLCMGTGYLAIMATKLIEEGFSKEEIKERLLPLTQNKIEHLFCVDTLEYLKRGGRIRASKALLAEILSIKPILNVQDAITQPIGKVRGRKKIIPYYMAHIEKNIDLENNDFISIAHSRDEAFANEFAEAFKVKFNWIKPVYISEIGATIGSHAGPGVLATFYIKKED
jgi:DegV family protein with EDD domain